HTALNPEMYSTALARNRTYLAKVAHQYAGKDDQGPADADGPAAEVAHVGVQGLDASEAQADAAQGLVARDASARKVEVAPVGVERAEHARVERDDVVYTHRCV